MHTIALRNGTTLPVLGQGTWNMGEDPACKAAEIHALQLGLDLGMTLIDTAEMYADGGAEQVVGEAIAGRRGRAYIVSKVFPHNASRAGVQAACERSLRRLNIEQIDMYLLHWRGSVPLAETLDAFARLRQAGKIAGYGVSNFDLDDMQEAQALAGGDGIAVNQVLYNLEKRGIEFDLLPLSRQAGIPVMAYSPLESSGPERLRMLAKPALVAVAARHGATPAQVALAWTLRAPGGVIAIPKAANPEHVRANRAALDLHLGDTDLAELDKVFEPPRRARPLAMR